jgi:hypothetical protein
MRVKLKENYGITIASECMGNKECIQNFSKDVKTFKWKQTAVEHLRKKIICFDASCIEVVRDKI